MNDVSGKNTERGSGANCLVAACSLFVEHDELRMPSTNECSPLTNHGIPNCRLSLSAAASWEDGFSSEDLYVSSPWAFQSSDFFFFFSVVI